VLDATVDDEIGDRRLSHSFASEILDDDALRVALAGAGLALHGWLDQRCRWAEARAQ
jgi:hypothetical protein